MADLATVRFQNKNCGSKTKRTGCDLSAVEILENPEASQSELKFNNIEQNLGHEENDQERQLLKILWRNGCRYRPVSWCFVLVFLWALLATIFCLGMFMHKANNKEEDSYAAFQKGLNSTTSENVDLMNLQQIKEQGQKVIEKISTDHNQLERNFEGFKAELRTSLSDLDYKKTKEINSARDEINKEISGVQEQIKSGFDKIQIQLQRAAVNFSSTGFSSIPAALISTPAPRFFLDEEYKGAWFAPAPGWEKKCTEMPSYMKKQASSVKLGGHCLLVCASANCESMCTQIHPDSYGLKDLAKLGFHDRIASFRQCKIN